MKEAAPNPPEKKSKFTKERREYRRPTRSGQLRRKTRPWGIQERTPPETEKESLVESGGIDPWQSEDVPEQVEPPDAKSLSYEWSTDEGLED